MDDMRSRNAQHELGVRMEHMNADIICIQETHDTKTEDRKIGNYRYISMGEIKSNNEQNEKGIGVAAIMIKEEWYKEIAKNNKTLSQEHTNNTKHRRCRQSTTNTKLLRPTHGLQQRTKRRILGRNKKYITNHKQKRHINLGN